MDLGPRAVPAVLEAVRSFNQFSPDNDPYGERDFGALAVLGHRIFWKIDLYERKVVKRGLEATPLKASKP